MGSDSIDFKIQYYGVPVTLVQYEDLDKSIESDPIDFDLHITYFTSQCTHTKLTAVCIN